MSQTIILESDIKRFFEHRQFSEKFARLGHHILEKLEQVQLIGQIEAENGKDTYLCLRRYLNEYVSSKSKDGVQLFEEAQTNKPFRAVLGLYAVWSSVYGFELNENTSSFWKHFYSGFTYVKGNHDKKVGDAFKQLLQDFENLVSFENFEQNTSWVHVSPILLHGLPEKHIERFVRDYVLIDSLYRHSIVEQRNQWLKQIQSTTRMSDTLSLFFEHGGDAAYTVTRSFMELRDGWNETGQIPSENVLPDYMMTTFKQLTQGNSQRSYFTKKIKHPAIKQPYLCFNLDRFLAPFIVIPTRQASVRPFRARISAEDACFSREISLETFLSGSLRFTRDALPENSFYKDALLVPPARLYKLSFGDESEVDLKVRDDFLIFDTRTGHQLDLYQDIRWPNELAVLFKAGYHVETDGQASEPAELQDRWQDWQYLLVTCALELTFISSGNHRRKFYTKAARQHISLSLQNPDCAPYWVHASNGLPIFTALDRLKIQLSGLTQTVRLALFRQDQSYALHRFSVAEPEIALPEKCVSLDAGVYSLVVESGMNNISTDFVYLPHATFTRSPEHCVTQPAKVIHFEPGSAFDHKLDPPWIKEEAGYSLKNIHQAAAKAELFSDSEQVTVVYFILQDIRWRRYGHAHLPHLSEMRIDADILSCYHIENLPDSRLRVEIEKPVFEALRNRREQVTVQVRDAEDTLLIPGHFSVNYHNYVFWDIDLLKYFESAKTLTQHFPLRVGLDLDTFFALVHLTPELYLQDLRVQNAEYIDHFLCVEMAWNPHPQDPPPEAMVFRIGTLKGERALLLHSETPEQSGYLSCRFLLPEGTETLDVYPELLAASSSNPFAAMSSLTKFESQKVQCSFSVKFASALDLESCSFQALVNHSANPEEWQEEVLLKFNQAVPWSHRKLNARVWPVDTHSEDAQQVEIERYFEDGMLHLDSIEHSQVWCLEILEWVQDKWRTLGVHQWTRQGRSIAFTHLQVTPLSIDDPGMWQISWSDETPRLEGELYFVFNQRLPIEKTDYVCFEPRGSRTEVYLPGISAKNEWEGYISLMPPAQKKGKIKQYTPPDHRFIWQPNVSLHQVQDNDDIEISGLQVISIQPHQQRSNSWCERVSLTLSRPLDPLSFYYFCVFPNLNLSHAQILDVERLKDNLVSFQAELCTKPGEWTIQLLKNDALSAPLSQASWVRHASRVPLQTTRFFLPSGKAVNIRVKWPHQTLAFEGKCFLISKLSNKSVFCQEVVYHSGEVDLCLPDPHLDWQFYLSLSPLEEHNLDKAALNTSLSQPRDKRIMANKQFHQETKQAIQSAQAAPTPSVNGFCRPASPINSLKALFHCLSSDSPQNKSESKTKWQQFLYIVNHEPQHLITEMGAKLFEELSPFAKGKQLRLKYSRLDKKPKTVDFVIKSKLVDSSYDYELFHGVMPGQQHYYSEISQNPDVGIGTLDLQPMDSERVYRADWKSHRFWLSKQGGKKGHNLVSDGNRRLSLKASFPVDQWQRPESWGSPVLYEIDSKMMLECAYSNPINLSVLCRVLYSDVQRISASASLKELRYWLNLRWQATTDHNTWEQFSFLTGTLAILSRYVSHYPEMNNHSVKKNFDKIIRDLEIILTRQIPSRYHEVLIAKICNDAMIAELILRWYIHKYLLKSQTFTITEPEKLFGAMIHAY